MDGLILSFQLFSRIPIKKEVEFSRENLRIALYCLPLVGLVIGAITGGVMFFFKFTNAPIASSLGLLTYFLVSGGLHLDGLSDMTDGFMANANKDRTLDIMKDSLIGSFGTIALILYFLMKFSLYASVDSRIIFTTAITSMVSRASVLLVIKRGKLARPDGFGAEMKKALNGEYITYIIYFIMGLGLIFITKNALSVLLVSLLIGIILEWISNRKIDGVTGDIYGAIIEISEIAILLVWRRFVIWI